jgi:hypothetical protein
VDEYAGSASGAVEILDRCTRGLDARFTSIARAASPEDLRLA